MRSVSKILTGWIMLAVVALPLFFIVYFLIQQKVIRHEMMEKLEKEYLIEISALSTEFNWVEEEKEIRVLGEMFDVKSYKKVGNRYFFKGLYDKDETALEKKLSGITTPEGEENEESLMNALRLLQSIFSSKNSGFQFLAVVDNKLKSVREQSSYLPHIYLHIPYPPPELLF